MHGAGLIIGLLAAVAALAWLARRLGIAYPILLVIGGVGLSLVPHLPSIRLEPDAVFLFFLPPLIYYSALQTTWRDFKANLRPITLLAVGLVIFTMCAVAVVAHTFIPGIPWPAAFLLGAIISPPDAIAATAILQQLQIPRRIIVVLEGESLVNDATALVAYRIALAAALAGGGFNIGFAAGQFLVAAVGGIAIGYAVGVIVAWIRPRVGDSGIDMTLSLLTPFLSYLPADALHTSGVLAVVTTGIYISRRLPHFASSQTRLRGYAMWETFVFILNGVVFILIGLQLREVLGTLVEEGTSLTQLVGYAAIISVVAILVRILWVFPGSYLPRLLVPSIRRKDPMPSWRPVFLVAWTGLRGIVSLAAALALPIMLPDNVTPFPGRNLIIFITFGVIFATLVLQGLTIAPVARWLGLGIDDDDGDEEVTARYLAALAAVEHLDRLASNKANDNGALDMIARLRETYDERIQLYSRHLAGDRNATDNECISCDTRGRVIRETIGAERTMLLRLRDDGVIGDEALRKVQHELDLEESRLEADDV